MPTDLELEPAEILEPDAKNATRPSQSAPMSGNRLPPLTVSNANKMIQFFQENPRFLANKYTSQAANNMLAASTKIVGMSIQLERVNNQTAAAKAQNEFASAKIKGLSEVSQYVPVDDVEGQTELGRLNGMVGTPDFNLTDFANGVSRLQSKYKKPGTPVVGESNRPVADTLTFADGKTVNVVYGPSGAPTVIKDGKEADDTYMKALQEVAKADLLDARKAVHKATGVDEREQALNGYYSAKRNFDSVFRTAKPAAAPATNAPAATTNTPAASSAIPMPSAKTELVPGTRYSTPRGEATWDGEKFVK